MSVAAETILADPRCLVSERETLTPRKNSLGSAYLAFHTDRETVLNLARLHLEDAFRRVVLDPMHGLVMLMAPGPIHEGIAGYIDNVVQETAEALDLGNDSLRSTRWRRSSDPQNTGAEPDCCYYLGANALTYQELREEEDAQAIAWTLSHPPDLVVEVGLTHIDRDKQELYRRLGVPEYWQVDRSSDRAFTVTFLDLQAGGGPASLAISAILPGLTPAALGAAVQALVQRRSQKRREVVLAVLREHGVVEQIP